MKKFLALLLIALCVCASASAEGKLTVSQKNLYVFDGEDNGYFFAKVENTGDEAVGLDSGKLVAFSDTDEILISESYVSSCPSGVVLEPGESVYVSEFLWDSALKDASVADYKFSVDTGNWATKIVRIPCEVSYELDASDVYNNYVYVTFTNPLKEPMYDLYAAVALLDAEGNLLFVDGNSASSIAVHPGSTVTMRMRIDSDLIEYYAAHGLTVATADAMVCYEAE